jgi:hypothetical protein
LKACGFFTGMGSKGNRFYRDEKRVGVLQLQSTGGLVPALLSSQFLHQVPQTRWQLGIFQAKVLP